MAAFAAAHDAAAGAGADVDDVEVLAAALAAHESDRFLAIVVRVSTPFLPDQGLPSKFCA